MTYSCVLKCTPLPFAESINVKCTCTVGLWGGWEKGGSCGKARRTVGACWEVRERWVPVEPYKEL